MKIEELKKVLKPLIRECIKEVLMEEKNVLSHVIRESINAVGGSQTIIQEQKEERMFDKQLRPSLPSKEKNQIQETKKKLLESIGKSAYGGVDIFEGTKPLSSGGSIVESMQAPSSALAGIAPDDPGIPVDKIFESAHLWAKIAAGNKKK
ncbi:MAG: hypothetical protein Q8P81_00615 [Nanoarchaeota archaeon]|nr:hypothetical protein [Nanoarchaeota archaeon]